MSYCEWNVPEQDITDYLGACKRFCRNDSEFDNFKRDRAYRVILEHTTQDGGQIFINQMKNLSSLTEDVVQRVKQNDIYGNPEIFSYDVFGQISPSTLRYVKNSLDLLEFFGENVNDVQNIVEIGGGYGGLCRVLSVFVNFENYVIIDLPEVNNLSEKYLGKFPDLDGRTSQLSCFELDEIVGADLVISNYAFSECSEDIQMHYYNNVIANSNRFYMAYNNFTKGNINSDGFIEIASKDFEIVVEDDRCPTGAPNVLLYGIRR